MKKVFVCLLALVALLSAVPFAVSAEEGRTVAYLASGSEGDGSSASSPVGYLTDALNSLDLTEDCTVVVCGLFTQKPDFTYKSEFTGTVTITSVYGGVDYREMGAEYVSGAYRFVCSGSYIFKDLNYRLTGSYYYIIANHYPVTLDTGINIVATSDSFNGDTVATAFTIMGGYQNGCPVVGDGEKPPVSGDKPVNITVRSGKGIVIGAYSRQIMNSDFSGKSTINIEGDAEIGRIYYVPVNGAHAANGKVEINVRGNAVVNSISTAGTEISALDSFVVNWESGKIVEFNRSPNTTVTNGFVLNYGAAADTMMLPILSLSFDTVNEIGGSAAPVTTAAPAEDTTAPAPAVTDAPAADTTTATAAETTAPFTGSGDTVIYIAAALSLAAIIVLSINRRKATSK